MARSNQYDHEGDLKQPVSTLDDPWAHRSARMRCTTCMWWVVKDANDGPERVNPLGRCRRHAPTLGGFPAVFSSDWCGDHKLSENA